MISSLKDIFNSITPENIRNIPLVNIAKKVFIESIESNAQVAKRITNIFDTTEDPNDSEHINRSKKNLKIGLYQTYIYGLYKYIQALASSKELRKELEKFNYTNAAIYQDIYKIISTEFIQSNHIFTQKVGTKDAMFYMYSFARYLETGKLENDLDISENNPYIIHYEGGLGRRLFQEFSKTQTHPLGFMDNYETVFKLFLHDYYGITIFDDYSDAYLECEGKYVFFTKDGDTARIYTEFREKINPLTNQPFTNDEIKAQVNILTGKIVSTFTKELNEDKFLTTTIVFTDQTVLQHVEDPSGKYTYYGTYTDYLNKFSKYIERWGSCYKLYAERQTNFIFEYTDYHEVLKDHYITMIKEENKGGKGLTCYNDRDHDWVFKVAGKEYRRIPGLAEDLYKCTNFDDVTELNKKFKCSLDYHTITPSDIIVSDLYGVSKRWTYKQGDGTVYFDSHGLGGNVYRSTVDDYINKPYWFEMTGLNDWNRKMRIEDVTIRVGSVTLTGKIYGDDGSFTAPKELNFSNLTNTSPTKGKDYYLKFTFFMKSHRLDLYPDDVFERYLDINKNDAFNLNFVRTVEVGYREFELKIDLHKKNGRYIRSEYYKGSNATAITAKSPRTAMLKWEHNETTAVPTVEAIDGVPNIPGIDSYHPSVHAHIAERPNGDFYKPLLLRESESTPDGYSNDGKVLIGEPYKKSFYTDYPEDNIFINLGFKDTCVDTSDIIIMDSPNFVTDSDISVDSKSNAFYLYSSPDVLLDDAPGSYFYTRDKFYLYTAETIPDVYMIDVTINLSGGLGVQHCKVPQGSKLKDVELILGYPFKEGYEFAGWSYNGETLDPDYVFKGFEPMTLIALYDVYDITIELDIGHGKWSDTLPRFGIDFTTSADINGVNIFKYQTNVHETGVVVVADTSAEKSKVQPTYAETYCTGTVKVFINGVLTSQNYKSLNLKKGDNVYISTDGTYGRISFNNDTTITEGIANTWLYSINGALPKLATTSLDNIFYMCTRLKSVSSRVFANNPQLTSLRYAFLGNHEMGTIPNEILHYTPELRDVGQMFVSCARLRYVPSVLFKYSNKITNAEYLFGNCLQLTSVPKDLFYPLVNLTKIDAAFALCVNLREVDENIFKTNTKLISAHGLFVGCKSLTTVGRIFKNQLLLENAHAMFEACSRLRTVHQDLFKTNNKIKDCTNLFYGCEMLEAIPHGLFNALTECTTFTSAFQNCTSINVIPTDLFRNCTSAVDFSYMFAQTNILATEEWLFKYNTDASNFEGVFALCTSLETIHENLFRYNTKIRNFGYVFFGCENLVPVLRMDLQTVTVPVSERFVKAFYGIKARGIMYTTRTFSANFDPDTNWLEVRV